MFTIFTTEHVYAVIMQWFSYFDEREVLQQEYSKPPILPSPHFRWIVIHVKTSEADTVKFPFLADIDECALRTSGCEQMCTNTVGGSYCTCHLGFDLNADGKTCTQGKSFLIFLML